MVKNRRMKIVLESENLKLIKRCKLSLYKGSGFFKTYLLISLLFVGCTNEKKPGTDQQKKSESSTVKLDIVGQKSITTVNQGRQYQV